MFPSRTTSKYRKSFKISIEGYQRTTEGKELDRPGIREQGSMQRWPGKCSHFSKEVSGKPGCKAKDWEASFAQGDAREPRNQQGSGSRARPQTVHVYI